MTTKKELDGLTYEIVGAAIEVHKALGPGLLESIIKNVLSMNFLSENYPTHRNS